MKKFTFLLSFCLVWFLPPAGQAAFPLDLSKLTGQNAASPAPQKKTYSEDEIQSLKDQNSTELEQDRQTVDQAVAGSPPEQLQNMKARIQVLEGLDLLYGDILDAMASQKKVKERLKSLDNEDAAWKTGSPPKDFAVDFNTLDRLRGQDVEAKKSMKSRAQLFKSRQEALDAAKKELQSAEEERRKARETAESETDPQQKIVAVQSLALAQLNSRAAEMRLLLRGLELDISKSYHDFFEKQQELTSLQIAYLESRVKFTDEDLKRETTLIEAEEDKISQSLEKARKDLVTAQKDYNQARKRLDETNEPPSSLIEEAEARRLAQSFQEQQNDLLGERLKQLKARKDYWKRRYQLLSGNVEKPEIGAWQQQTHQLLDQLARDEDLTNLRINSLRNASVEIEEKISAKGETGGEAQHWLQAQKEEVQKTLDLLQDQSASLLLSQKMNEKFLAEQESRYSQVTLKERLQRIWDGFVRVWNIEITSVDDSPITVSKVFFAIIFMVFGLILAKRLSRMLAERILPRFGVTPGVAAALKTLSYYAMLWLFILIALHLVRVPLTLFAVLGGAIAIGIGFGSQNLMNNFISGLILLIERPIKVGDIIEMDGNSGVVEQIGGRSTQIRTFSNIHLIVPNSAFLEKTVINWTLSDNMVRSNIRIGVDYGSPTRDVVNLLKLAADSHGKVLKNPEPIVLFSDFGADALVFDLYFWIRMQTALERRIIESDLRHIVEHSFSEANIGFAFPQHDVHLDSKRPLEVRLVRDDDKN